LVAVEADQFDLFPIEEKAFRRELGFPETHHQRQRIHPIRDLRVASRR
jgi:hypothetical protein